MTLPLILDAHRASQLLKTGALDPALLSRKEGSVGGLLPQPDVVNAFLKEAGLNPGDHVLAYDAGASTAAARLIWVLHAYGHFQTSWLDGGFSAWNAQQLTTESGNTTLPQGALHLDVLGDNVVSAEALVAELI